MGYSLFQESNPPGEFPLATLTPQEEVLLAEAHYYLEEGKTFQARRKLHPLLERICNDGEEIPSTIEDIYATILLTEKIQHEENSTGNSPNKMQYTHS